MKKPKKPNNYNFWLFVLQNSSEVKKFQTKGNKRQKKEIERAINYQKWEQIQQRKK